jgi:uncharacterized protein (DUF169 family)
MESKISSALKLKFPPVALRFSDAKPADAKEFKPGKWGCVMWLLSAAAKGKSAAASAETFGCQGGGVGLGFGDRNREFPGGREGFCRFLSTGNDQTEQGRAIAEKIKPYMRPENHENFLHGERYIKSPELVEKFVDGLPITQIPTKYVVMQPLSILSADARPEVVVFLADPDQLAALVVLANYGRGDNQNVIIPYAAGCQTIGIYPYQEARSDRPRAVVGLTDLSARLYLRRLLGGDLLSFAAPLALFQEMEANVPGSFLEMPTFKKLMALRDASAPPLEEED